MSRMRRRCLPSDFASRISPLKWSIQGAEIARLVGTPTSFSGRDDHTSAIKSFGATLASEPFAQLSSHSHRKVRTGVLRRCERLAAVCDLAWKLLRCIDLNPLTGAWSRVYRCVRKSGFAGAQARISKWFRPRALARVGETNPVLTPFREGRSRKLYVRVGRFSDHPRLSVAGSEVHVRESSSRPLIAHHRPNIPRKAVTGVGRAPLAGRGYFFDFNEWRHFGLLS